MLKPTIISSIWLTTTGLVIEQWNNKKLTKPQIPLVWFVVDLCTATNPQQIKLMEFHHNSYSFNYKYVLKPTIIPSIWLTTTSLVI